MNEYRPTEHVVDFGDYRSSRFVSLNMALIESNGAKLHERIVRCRDCAHYADHEWITSPQYGLGSDFEHVCHFWHGKPTKVEPNGFCAWGERKAVDDAGA